MKGFLGNSFNFNLCASGINSKRLRVILKEGIHPRGGKLARKHGGTLGPTKTAFSGYSRRTDKRDETAN